jgi:polyhydroxybutyrate depolymerase
MKSWTAAVFLTVAATAGCSSSAPAAAPGSMQPASTEPGAANNAGSAAQSGTTAQVQAGASAASGGSAPVTAPPAAASDAGASQPATPPASDSDAGAPGDDTPSSSAADASTAPAPDAGLDAGQPEEPMQVACPSDALAAGDSNGTLMHDGVRRDFLIHVPRGYDNQTAVPLVVNFHGATSNAEQQRSLFSLMDATSDEKGFVVVYPQGIGDSWNAGACCGDAQSQNVDDVGFARALVEYMTEHTCIDRKRVYATGFSNGGRMSYRLGCEAADMFAAIGPVAGTKSFPDLNNTAGCMPSRPLSLIDFMGSADMRIEAQPGQIKEWVAFNGCTDAQPAETYRMGAHYCMAYTQCSAGTSVTYCVIDGGGHCWPGSSPCPLGATSRADELSANALMWELFQRSTL